MHNKQTIAVKYLKFIKTTTTAIHPDFGSNIHQISPKTVLDTNHKNYSKSLIKKTSKHTKSQNQNIF
jgi:hypothetical protein